MKTALDAAIAEFLVRRTAAGLAASSLKNLSKGLTKLCRFCARRGLTDPAEITPADIEDFLIYLQTAWRWRRGNATRTGLTPAVRMGILSHVRTFLAFQVSEERMLYNPAALVSFLFSKVGPVPRTMAPQEIDALVAGLDLESPVGLRDRALVEVLFGCGLRCRELLSLDLSDVDLGAGVVCVRSGKGGRRRWVPLSGTAHQALDLYLRQGRPELVQSVQDAAVFLSEHHLRMSAAALRSRLCHLGHVAKVHRPINPHAFRHGYATALLNGGADSRAVQELLGHVDLRSTQRYTHLDIRDLLVVYRKTHPRGRQP